MENVELFYEVFNSIHAIRDLDEMLKSILGKIKAVFHIEGASIAIHDSENKEFCFIRTVEEERLLEILSGTIAIAIENAQFYGELKLPM